MAAPLPLPLASSMKPDGRAPDTSPADGPAFEGPAFEGPAFDGTPLHLPHGAPTAQTLAWWAGGLLNAVAAADVSEDGEPILAAAGHAATAALLLLQRRTASARTRWPSSANCYSSAPPPQHPQRPQPAGRQQP